MAADQLTADAQVQASLTLLQDMVRGYAPRNFAVRFWDGTTWNTDAGQQADFTLVLNHPGALRKMFWPPTPLSMGQAYLYDDFNIEGDMLAFTWFCDYLEKLPTKLSLFQRLGLGLRIFKMPRVERPRTGRQSVQLHGTKHSRERDHQAISYHYDISNEFFARILGKWVVYTGAYFADPKESLEAAQERKLDLVCRKLRLKEGERLLDVGCGWGGLILFAAKNYGAHSVGVTISTKQHEWINAEIRAAGLQDRCRVDLVDYRDMDETQPFDKIATLEVLEHLGAAQYPAYFQKCMRLLRPHGSLFIQQIINPDPMGMPGASVFSGSYIFPDGEHVPLTYTLGAAAEAGFEVRDVEAVREHYVLTNQHWLQRLESQHDELVRLTDEATYRTFRLLFAGACLGMVRNIYNLYHMLYVKPDKATSGYPLEREDWYKA